jgi:hypothetical protein
MSTTPIPPFSPGNEKIKSDLIKSTERVAELKSIHRNSTVGEIASKFTGQSVAESRVNFQQKQRNISQRERILQRAMYYFQLNKKRDQNKLSIDTDAGEIRTPDASANTTPKGPEYIPSLTSVQSFWKTNELASKSSDRSVSPLPRRSMSPTPDIHTYSPVRFISPPRRSISPTPNSQGNEQSPSRTPNEVRSTTYVKHSYVGSATPFSQPIEKVTSKDVEDTLAKVGISRKSVNAREWAMWKEAIAAVVEDEHKANITGDIGMGRSNSDDIISDLPVHREPSLSSVSEDSHKALEAASNSIQVNREERISSFDLEEDKNRRSRSSSIIAPIIEESEEDISPAICEKSDSPTVEVKSDPVVTIEEIPIIPQENSEKIINQENLETPNSIKEDHVEDTVLVEDSTRINEAKETIAESSCNVQLHEIQSQPYQVDAVSTIIEEKQDTSENVAAEKDLSVQEEHPAHSNIEPRNLEELLIQQEEFIPESKIQQTNSSQSSEVSVLNEVTSSVAVGELPEVILEFSESSYIHESLHRPSIEAPAPAAKMPKKGKPQLSIAESVQSVEAPSSIEYSHPSPDSQMPSTSAGFVGIMCLSDEEDESNETIESNVEIPSTDPPLLSTPQLVSVSVQQVADKSPTAISPNAQRRKSETIHASPHYLSEIVTKEDSDDDNEELIDQTSGVEVLPVVAIPKDVEIPSPPAVVIEPPPSQISSSSSASSPSSAASNRGNRQSNNLLSSSSSSSGAGSPLAAASQTQPQHSPSRFHLVEKPFGQDSDDDADEDFIDQTENFVQSPAKPILGANAAATVNIGQSVPPPSQPVATIRAESEDEDDDLIDQTESFDNSPVGNTLQPDHKQIPSQRNRSIQYSSSSDSLENIPVQSSSQSQQANSKPLVTAWVVAEKKITSTDQRKQPSEIPKAEDPTPVATSVSSTTVPASSSDSSSSLIIYGSLAMLLLAIILYFYLFSSTSDPTTGVDASSSSDGLQVILFSCLVVLSTLTLSSFLSEFETC